MYCPLLLSLREFPYPIYEKTDRPGKRTKSSVTGSVLDSDVDAGEYRYM
jgi:hypothetical protein